jgi:hypothetical protein
MILKNVPPSILVALGLGCGPATEDDASASACLSSYDDDGTDVGPCLSECLSTFSESEEGTTEESDVGPCLDATGCLTDIDTSTGTSGSESETGGFIGASSDTSGSDSGTGSSSGTESGDESGSDSGTSGSSTSGGIEDASPRARSWREALQRMDDGGTLPSDVLARLRAQKGPR